MPQARRFPTAAAPDPLTFHRYLYMEARERVLRHRDSLGDVTDPTSARDWISSFGESMRGLSVSGEAVAADPSEDSEVQALLDHARNVTIIFATVEWIELSPDFVKGVEEVLRKLPPGETLGSAFPLDRSASSGLSGLPVPPRSHTPPSGSGVPRPAEPEPAGGRSEPVHSPHRTRFLLAHPKPSPVAAVVAARKALLVSGPRKRPTDWVTCERCQSRRKGCSPPSAVKPPYTSCYSCLKDGVECVPAPRASGASRTRRRQRVARSSVSAPALSPPAGPPSEGSDDDQSSDALPAVPLYGTAAVPLPVLLAWRDEIRDAGVEHDSARNALSAAVAARDEAERQVQIVESRVKTVDERNCVARRNYLELVGRVVATLNGEGEGIVGSQKVTGRV